MKYIYKEKVYDNARDLLNKLEDEKKIWLETVYTGKDGQQIGSSDFESEDTIVDMANIWYKIGIEKVED